LEAQKTRSQKNVENRSDFQHNYFTLCWMFFCF
jgi:hypothetical protein